MIPSGSSLAFWLGCIVVGLVAAFSITWALRRGKEVWVSLRRRERIFARCLAIAALWCILALLEHDRLVATWMTAAVALLWGAYLLFSRAIDGIWSRMRRH